MGKIYCLVLAALFVFAQVSFAKDRRPAQENSLQDIVKMIFGDSKSAIKGGGEDGGGNGCSFKIVATGSSLKFTSTTSGEGGNTKSGEAYNSQSSLSVSSSPSSFLAPEGNAPAGTIDLFLQQGNTKTALTVTPGASGQAATVRDMDGCGQDM